MNREPFTGNSATTPEGSEALAHVGDALLAPAVERLQAENQHLRATVEELRRTLQLLQGHPAEVKSDTLEALAYAEAIGETVRESVLVLDAEFTVKAANPAFFETFRASWEKTLGRRLAEIEDGQWNIPSLLELLTQILAGQSPVENLQIDHDFTALGRRRLEVKVCHARPSRGTSTLILLVIEDVTDRTRAADSLRSSEARLRALVSSLDDIVFEVDEQGRCLSAWTANRQLLARSRQDRQVQSIEDFLPIQSAGPLRQAFESTVTTSKPESAEYSVDVGGTTRWFLARINRIAFHEGLQKTLSILVREVTERKQAEIALLQSEEKFRLLVEGVKDYAIYALDAQGRVVSWNRGAERIKGYTREEIIGKHFSIFYLPEDVAAGKPEKDLEIAAAEGRLEDIGGWRRRKDGSHFYANLLISAIHDEHGVLRGFAKVTRDVTEWKRAEDAVRKLSGHVLRLQDEERRRIARELHDSTAQLLTALSMNLSLVARCPELAADSQATRLLAESEVLARQASDEIRNISHLLHPPDLDAVGLAAAVRWYTARFGERTGILVKLDVPGNLRRLPQEHEIALFRVVQESLTNVQRHSGSKVVRIRIRPCDDHVELAVEDRGRGIPAGILAPEHEGVERLGMGVAGMRERMKQLGGRLEIVSGPRGTKVQATLPCPRMEVACPPDGAAKITPQ